MPCAKLSRNGLFGCAELFANIKGLGNGLQVSYVLSGEGDTYRPDTLAYISGQGVSSGINTVASILGISATAIAGAMAEEADSYYRRSWRVDTLDQYALSAVAVGSDAWQKLWFAIKMGPDSADA